MGRKDVKDVLKALEKAGELKLIPIKYCDNKFKVELIDKDVPIKFRKKRSENFVLASHFKFSQYKLVIELKGIDYPIEMKFRKVKKGYSKIACDIYRASGYRKGKDDDAIKKLIEKRSKLTNETMSKNIGDSLGKFLMPVGGNVLRDLLFDYSGKKLKYKRFVYVKDLKQKDIGTLKMKNKNFIFDFEDKVWVEESKNKTNLSEKNA